MQLNNVRTKNRMRKDLTEQLQINTEGSANQSMFTQKSFELSGSYYLVSVLVFEALD